MRAERLAAARARLRADAEVLRLFVEGLSLEETARELRCSPAAVAATRRWLGLITGRQHRAGVPAFGRLDSREKLEALLPAAVRLGQSAR